MRDQNARAENAGPENASSLLANFDGAATRELEGSLFYSSGPETCTMYW